MARTITVDGDMSDWDGVRDNPGQFTTDERGNTPADLDYAVASTGRDLRKFSFTYDMTNLYFYVERYANANNRTDWWFYVDTDDDGLVESNEYVLNVRWQGSNRSTDRILWQYVPAAAGGDPVTVGAPPKGDGYDMPGAITAPQSLGSLSGGSSTGTEMESFLAWTQLGLPGPSNIGFHVASSNGANLPNQLDDNMDAPGGGRLALTPDIAVVKSVQTAQDPVNSSANPKSLPGAWLDYRIVVSNRGTSAAEQVDIVDDVPADLALFVGALAGPSPIEFIDGAGPASSGLTFTFTSLASNTDSVDFSRDGGADGFTYVPIPDADGFDSAVTHVRIRPTGTLNGRVPGVLPQFTLRLRARVR